MRRYVRRIILSTVVLLGSVVFVQPITLVSAVGWGNSGSCGIDGASEVGCDTQGSGDSSGTISVILNFVMGMTAVVSIVAIVIGGARYTASQGQAEKVAQARRMILYGVVGLVVSLLAMAIVWFVLSQVFPSNTPTP